MKDTATIAREVVRRKQFRDGIKITLGTIAMLLVVVALAANASEPIAEPLPEYDASGIHGSD